MTGHVHGRRTALHRRHVHGHHERRDDAHVDLGAALAFIEPPPDPQPFIPPSNSLHTLTRRTDCAADDDSPMCEKPAGAQNNTLPILLGALIPIGCALIVLVYLHRRHQKKVQMEDQMDKTKSMDFGLGSRGDGEKGEGRSRQMSMDLNLTSPYLLPGAINGSRDSLVRSPVSMDDRYGRPMTAGSHRNGASSHQQQSRQMNRRDSSQYEQSMYPRSDSPSGRSSMDAGLLKGASRMPTSTPPPGAERSGSHDKKPLVPQINIPTGRKSPSANGLPASPRAGVFPRGPDGAASPRSPSPNQDKLNASAAAPRPVSDFDEPNFNFEDSAQFAARDSTKGMAQPTPNGLQIRIENPDMALLTGTFDYESRNTPTAENFPKNGSPNDIEFRFSVASADPQQDDGPAGKPNGANGLTPQSMETRRLSMGSRPLPPDGNPNDTAEERAMRIRSFYKEYFSVEEANPPPMPGQIPAQYLQQHGVELDQKSGGYVIPGARPFAEGPVRRAMTPPPRMPPRFDGHPNAGPRADSSISMRPPNGGIRSATSASGQIKNQKPLEPPKPLQFLPTPSKMSEDAFASPTMFAPRARIHEEQHDLRGGLRPYSPSVSPHVPLVTSFDDLAVLPSPHMLRRSGNFTALDFAPPRKFKNDDGTGSDAGSIRSQGSGINPVHANNIKQGAYRVSKIPTAVVPLRDHMAEELKPSWGMRDGSS